MLTSPGNQYLRPEYLTPLPTTLDAKKSPLALLAQTCSQIGADTPNAKLLQSSESKSKNPSKHQDKSSQSSQSSLNSQREKSRSPEERSTSSSNSSRVKTPKSCASNNGRCSSNQSATSPRSSPAAAEQRKTPDRQQQQRSPNVKSQNSSSPPPPQTSASSKTAFTTNILTSSSDPAIKDLPLGTFKPGVPPTSAYLPYPGYPLSMDLMTTSLMSMKNGLSPYLGYGRVKAADSVCRDPYCTGCGLSSHLLSAAKTSPTCPAGCAQCDHAKPVSSAASYLGHSQAAAAYAHAQLAALAAASHLPYVCNWISGDASYCGKRFSSSEELLSHLRTHTAGVATSEASLMHPLLHRTYPTPPLSPLATARYHPYSKPSLLPPSLTSALPGFPLTHPGLPPYLSPYSLYGPRLGAAPGMHP